MFFNTNYSNVYGANQVQNINQNHVFYDLLGGKDKYDNLPILDFSTLKQWNGNSNYQESISFDDVTASIMKGINGKPDHQYLVIKFIANGKKGLSVLISMNLNNSNFIEFHCAGESFLEWRISEVRNMTSFTKSQLYKKLLTEGCVEGNNVTIKLLA